MPSASANAHLVAAGMIAAGILGIEAKLPLPPPKQEDAQRLPTTLEDALAALDADAALRSKVGDGLVDVFLLLKRAELAAVAARIAGASAGTAEEEATLEAWRHFYFEFV